MHSYTRKRLLALLALVLTTGCSGAVETSPAAYEHLKSLYQITNQRNSETLELVASKIKSDQESGKITSAEAESLLEIVGDARNGEWKAANGAARELMEAQLRAN
ncbi:MAG: hypothetical protein RH917_19520 [Lacipirellulaceae bacterium]